MYLKKQTKEKLFLIPYRHSIRIPVSWDTYWQIHIPTTPLHWAVWSQSKKSKQMHCVGEEDGESVLDTLSMASMRRSWQSCTATESQMWSRPTSSPSWIVVSDLRLGEEVTNPFLLPVFAFGITANKHLNLWWKQQDDWSQWPMQWRRLTYCVRKKSLHYSSHNCYKFRHNLLIFDMNHRNILILQRGKNRKCIPTLQHHFLEMASYLTSSKCRLQTKTDI